MGLYSCFRGMEDPYTSTVLGYTVEVGDLKVEER